MWRPYAPECTKKVNKLVINNVLLRFSVWMTVIYPYCCVSMFTESAIPTKVGFIVAFGCGSEVGVTYMNHINKFCLKVNIST